MFDYEPVKFCRDAHDDATEDLDRRNIVRVDRSLTASASSKEDVFILALCEESDCDALLGCRYRHPSSASQSDSSQRARIKTSSLLLALAVRERSTRTILRRSRSSVASSCASRQNLTGS